MAILSRIVPTPEVLAERHPLAEGSFGKSIRSITSIGNIFSMLSMSEVPCRIVLPEIDGLFRMRLSSFESFSFHFQIFIQLSNLSYSYFPVLKMAC